MFKSFEPISQMIDLEGTRDGRFDFNSMFYIGLTRIIMINMFIMKSHFN